jgi:microcystin-dependent protein
MTSLLRTNAALTARTKPMVGDVKHSFILDDHMGWLRCDGRALDKTAFNLLFQVVGYAFGGSGNTFYLPDAQGRVVGNTGYVVDDNEHTRTFAPGESIGELDHRLTVGEMPAHNHNNATGSIGDNTTANGTTSSYTHSHGGNTGEGGQAAESETVVGTVVAAHSDAIVTGSGTHHHSIAADTHAHTIASNGGDQYHNNIQPTIFIGSTFMYSGLPAYGFYPYKTGRSPVLI